MSDATQQLLINGGYAVLLALISAWAGWKSQQAKDASKANTVAIEGVQQSADKAVVEAKAAVVEAKQAVIVSEAGNEQVAKVHTLVNGQREAMLKEIEDLKTKATALEAENRKLRGN